jgi:hypothetical protein
MRGRGIRATPGGTHASPFHGRKRSRRRRYLRGLIAAAGVVGIGLAFGCGAVGSHAETGAPASTPKGTPVRLEGVPSGALNDAGIRAVRSANRPAGVIAESAARSMAKKRFGSASVRDAALVECNVPGGPVELRAPRPCWAVSLSAENVISSGPIQAPRVKGTYRVVFLDAKNGGFVVGVEGRAR